MKVGESLYRRIWSWVHCRGFERWVNIWDERTSGANILKQNWANPIYILTRTGEKPLGNRGDCCMRSECHHKVRKTNWQVESPSGGCCNLWKLASCLHFTVVPCGTSQVALVLKNPPANSEDKRDMVRSLGWEDPLEEDMATHSSIFAWRIPWTEEPGGLQSTGHNWSNLAHALFFKSCLTKEMLCFLFCLLWLSEYYFWKCFS